MKTIEDRAHEILLKMLEGINPMQLEKPTRDGLAYEAFELAEAMQAEAEKRKAKGDARSLTKDEHGNCLHFHHEFGHKKCMDCGASLEEWQPDWSVAPEWANFWCMQSYSGWCYWTESQPAKKWDQFRLVKCEQAPSFNYKGDWKDSLRKRP